MKMNKAEQDTRKRLEERFGIEDVQKKTMAELEAEIVEKLKRSTTSLGTYERRRAKALVEAAKGGTTMREVVLPEPEEPKPVGSRRPGNLTPLELWRREH